MFGLGPTELIVILILGVLLLGPQRIPEFASSLGKAIRSFRRATRELRDQIDIEDEVRKPLEDLRAALRDEPPPPPIAPPAPLYKPPVEETLSAGAEKAEAPPAESGAKHADVHAPPPLPPAHEHKPEHEPKAAGAVTPSEAHAK